LSSQTDTPLNIGSDVILFSSAKEEARCMDHQIGTHSTRQLPEVSSDPANVKLLILNDPLTSKLSPQLGGITHRKHYPSPTGILRDAQEKIASDEPCGTGN
jgi:uncharacterized membrane-anchored protein